MDLRPGQKLHSAVCDAEFVVVKAPSEAVDLRCGGAPLLQDGETPEGSPTLDESLGEAPQLGKRYADEQLGLELLCAKAGKGALTIGDQPLLLKGAKPLPSSD